MPPRRSVLLGAIAAAGCSPAASPVAPVAPSPTGPSVFAPGVISGPAGDSAPAFTPDGNTVYFGRRSAILVSHRDGQTWSAPQVAAFSGRWGDYEPAIAPDGSFMIFVSNRPAREPGPALDGEYGYPTRTVSKAGGGNLWRMERRGDGWGPAVRLPDTVNRGSTVWEPSIVADGSLYFMDAHLPGRFRIYRSQLRDGVYRDPVPLPFSDGTWSDVDATVAPDESFMVLASNRAPVIAGHGHDLFIVLRKDGVWGDVTHLGLEINSDAANEVTPRLGPDHHTVYFTSERTTPSSFPRTAEALRDETARDWDNGLQNIWQFDVSPWLAGAASAR
jgi:hypothetical protein